MPMRLIKQTNKNEMRDEACYSSGLTLHELPSGMGGGSLIYLLACEEQVQFIWG